MEYGKHDDLLRSVRVRINSMFQVLLYVLNVWRDMSLPGDSLKVCFCLVNIASWDQLTNSRKSYLVFHGYQIWNKSGTFFILDFRTFWRPLPDRISYWLKITPNLTNINLLKSICSQKILTKMISNSKL